MEWLDRVARTLGEVVTAIRLGVRSSTLVDTNPVPAEWDHITKIDPEDGKDLPLLYPLYLRHTSAISIGGSKDVTNENTAETFAVLQQTDVPLFHEPSAPHHITEQTWKQSHFTTIPEVLNGDSASLIGKLGVAIENSRDEIIPGLLADTAPWLPRWSRAFLSDFLTALFLQKAVFEAYIIQNPDSAAARQSNVTAEDCLSSREAARRALAAEKHLESEAVYVEYSGTFGGEEGADIVAAVADACSWSRVWYGGGLDSRERAERILDAGADAIIVGNVFHAIADEERDLCARAVDALDPDASRSDVREWLTDAVDVGESSATRYLETVPSVPDPELTATRYLVETVRVRLALEALAADLDDADADEMRRTVEARDDLPGADVLDGATNDPTGVARTVALGHLAARTDADVAPFSTVRLGGADIR